MARVLISIPDGLLEAIDAQADKEYRTRSELLRECFRSYLKKAERKVVEVEEITDAQEENEDGRGPVSVGD